VQLDLITGLYRRNRKIAIGMEMFQRPFQKTLDAFIKGRLDEKDFLVQTEYFKRWGFDYNLYKPILDFARSEGVPVVALNAEREIIRKVSRSGLDSLSEEEKRKIPPEMDFSDREYMERLKKIFGRHKGSGEKKFVFFYQSQILWDETMSSSIDEFLSANPDYQMVVLAGQGHLEYGSGIPARTFRRNGFEYSIVLIDATVEEGIADYVIFPKPVEGTTSPKLMAFLSEINGNVRITGFPEGSVSERAGLKVGDIIVSIDGVMIGGVDEIKLHLFYKSRGDTISVKVIRREKDRDVEITAKVKL
jgi:uncharacterized iron-regulated protein